MKLNNLKLTDAQLANLRTFIDRSELKVSEVPVLLDLVNAISLATPIEEEEVSSKLEETV